jgi:hypothetical protein
MPLTDALPMLLALAVALFILALLSRQISLRIQTITAYLTRSPDMAMVTVFLLFLPGIVVHELSHWVVAKVLGLRPSRFRVWPQRQGGYIGLGSVNIRSGGMWLDSLVGLAPLLTGTFLVALIGYQVFGSNELLAVLSQNQWSRTAAVFLAAISARDGAVWAYLIFAIANSMMPSRSDRQPVMPLLLYIAFAALVYFVIGLPGDLFTTLLGWLAPAFQIVTGALIFTILLDALVLAILVPVEFLLSGRYTRFGNR